MLTKNFDYKKQLSFDVNCFTFFCDTIDVNFYWLTIYALLDEEMAYTVFFFSTWYISCYVSRWFTFALLWYDSLIFHFQVFFVMSIYIKRRFIISLIGKNSISGFPLCLKKCEDENKIRTKTYIKKKISTSHITGLMLKAIPLSSS